jgi:hypothetical protein
VGGKWGLGAGGKMTLALYAHMNNKIIIKKFVTYQDCVVHLP